MKKILSFVIVCAMMLGMLSFVSFADEQTMQVLPFNEGMENWTGGTGGNQTQLLICPKDAEGNKIAAAYTDTAAEWTITLTPETGDAKTVKLTQTSQYDGGSWGIIRFEPCLAEGDNQFIPVKDMKYTVTASFTSDGTTYTGTSETGAFYLPGVDPVVPGVEPEITWPGTMTLVPKFGGAENWRGSTWLLLGPTCDNEDFKTVVGPKIKDGTYDVKYVVTDETTGEKYIMEDYFFDHDDKTTWAEPNGVGVWNWTEVDTANTLLRLCASDYGIPVVVGHTYTVTGEVTEAGELRYNITSATGAFVPADGKFPAEAGPAEGFVPPHSYTTEDVEPPVVGPEEIKVGVYGTGWENWSEQTQLLIVAPFDSKVEGATAYTWEITFAGTTFTLVPSSYYDYGNGSAIWRFQTCLGEGENQYVPVAGTTGSVTAKVYNGEEQIYTATSDDTWTVPEGFQPIVPEPPVTPPVTPPETGDAAVYAIVFAVVAMLGMAVVVTKKVNA